MDVGAGGSVVGFSLTADPSGNLDPLSPQALDIDMSDAAVGVTTQGFCTSLVPENTLNWDLHGTVLGASGKDLEVRRVSDNKLIADGETVKVPGGAPNQERTIRFKVIARGDDIQFDASDAVTVVDT
jgi:hypothetical protein